MTYKALVTELVRVESEKYVKKLLNDNQIKYEWTEAKVINLDNKTIKEQIFFKTMVTITFRPNRQRFTEKKLIVGGTADDWFGICPSAVWSIDEDERIDAPVWLATEESRKVLGIEKFSLD